MRFLLSGYETTSWGAISVLIFFALFIVLICRLYSPRNRDALEQESRIPFDEPTTAKINYKEN